MKKVKKGKYCITFMLQLNLTKLNLDRSSSLRRVLQSSVVKTFPCSGCFTACMSARFPTVNGLHGLDDLLWHGSK